MRLLHTTELRFEEFFDSDVPEYAILSHRWGADEVSYQDFIAIRKNYFKTGLEMLELHFPGWFDVFKSLITGVTTWILGPVLFGTLVGYGVSRYLLVTLALASLLLLARAPAVKLVQPKQYGSGYAKILACCRYAAGGSAFGPFRWVWIDTCCIDKSSSAELSEAINSMYRWYEKASVCYAYLSDVSGSADVNPPLASPWRRSKRFGASEWFTRGWTLQELLAPCEVVFLDMSWEYLGIRSKLAAEIATITGISQDHIKKSRYDPRLAKIATKLSWAAKRHTSRQEDAAYCLLGLSTINMPLLYGEAQNAFRRLQLELVRSTADESVFLWNAPYSPSFLRTSAGLIAHAAEQYKYEGSRHENEFDKIQGVTRPPYSITNQGLELTVPEELARKSTFLLLLIVVITKETWSKVHTPYVFRRQTRPGRGDLLINGRRIFPFSMGEYIASELVYTLCLWSGYGVARILQEEAVSSFTQEYFLGKGYLRVAPSSCDFMIESTNSKILEIEH